MDFTYGENCIIKLFSKPCLVPMLLKNQSLCLGDEEFVVSGRRVSQDTRILKCVRRREFEQKTIAELMCCCHVREREARARWEIDKHVGKRGGMSNLC